MNDIYTLQYKNQSREQLHSGLAEDFPCVTSLVKINGYPEETVPWHWHEELELFYMEEGTLEYDIPKGKIIFPKGSGGLVNSNVLHMTKARARNTVQRLHIFAPSLISGSPGSRIERKYVSPILASQQIEILPLFPDDPGHREILEQLRGSFLLTQDEDGYEIELREALSRIWRGILTLARPLLEHPAVIDKGSDKLKAMMIYIHEHYGEKLSVKQIASASFLSERECFRIFHEYLSMTPVDYLRSYRLQKACYLLSGGSESITAIGQACGFGSSSYFGKIFRESIGCTPQEYRKNGGIVASTGPSSYSL